MRARNTILAGLALLAASGCAYSSAPRGWLRPAVEAQSDPYGGWVSLHVGKGSTRAVHDGELLVIEPDSVFILERGTCVGFATAEVVSASLMEYDSQQGRLATWTAIGAFSTLSHGLVAALSFPVWVITGVAATAAQSHAPHKTLTPNRWEAGRAFARFPQGWPAGLDRSSLRPKPAPGPKPYVPHPSD